MLEMIILFGSYARGDFVEKDVNFVEGHYEEYKSDFDMLLITRNPIEKNMKLEREIRESINKIGVIDTPVSLIVEDIGHINKMLEENRYFYADIKKEGILLYDSKKCKLSSAKNLAEEERRKMKQEDYDSWFKGGERFFEFYETGYEKDYLNESAFMLHQTAEKYLTAKKSLNLTYYFGELPFLKINKQKENKGNLAFKFKIKLFCVSLVCFYLIYLIGKNNKSNFDFGGRSFISYSSPKQLIV